MIDQVRYPAMRLDLIEALQALADRAYQDECWGVHDATTGRFDDLGMNVNILYDVRVFPDPRAAVGAVVLEGEVSALKALHDVLEPLIVEFGDRPDAVYTSDGRWPNVVEAAARALAVIREGGSDAGVQGE